MARSFEMDFYDIIILTIKSTFRWKIYILCVEKNYENDLWSGLTRITSRAAGKTCAETCSSATLQDG